MRVGLGIDTHQLIKGTILRIGGVNIPSTVKIKAHSDGDIIYHACADSLYGAIGFGDIGEHFPDIDIKNKDLDSSVILSHSYKCIVDKGLKINNLDITLLLESPKITKYKDLIKNNLSRILMVEPMLINIKASTSESLGFIGKGQGITCYSIVSLV